MINCLSVSKKQGMTTMLFNEQCSTCNGTI